jgi:hypothetical protein
MLTIRWPAAPSARAFGAGGAVAAGSRFDSSTAQGTLYRDRYWNDAYLDALAEIHRSCEGHGLDAVSVALCWLVHHSLSPGHCWPVGKYGFMLDAEDLGRKRTGGFGQSKYRSGHSRPHSRGGSRRCADPCILRASSKAGIKCSDRSARELQKYGCNVDHPAKTTLPNGRSSIRWRKASPVSPRE